MAEVRDDAARRLWRLWQNGQQPDLAEFLAATEPLDPVALAGVLRTDQCQRWLRGQRIPAEQYLRAFPTVAADTEAALDVVYAEFLLRQEQGEAVSPIDFLQRFPHLADQLRLQLDFGQALISTRPDSTPAPPVEIRGKASPGTVVDGPPKTAPPGGTVPITLRPEAHACGPAPSAAPIPAPAGPTRQIRCPHCHNPIQVGDSHSDQVLCPGCGSGFWLREAQHTTTVQPMRLGKFELLERVGLGAFGAVWRARDTELDRVVALKIPHAGLGITPAELKCVYDEARKIARLRHPGIVTVHEVANLQGLPVIVSDFIQGLTLSDLRQMRRLTVRETATLIAAVADALDYAHSHGMVHRDIKPANLMVQAGAEAGTGSVDPARPLILDFGLALKEQAAVTMTLDGVIIGTPAYMSPEQAAGKGHQADRRSDVFSLGVVLYELLCGELPFRGSQRMLLLQVQFEEPRAPRRVNDKIPRDLETVCLKCLHKDPARRYQTAAALAKDLRHYLNGEPIDARPSGRVERLWRWCKRHPGEAWLASTVLTLLVVLAVGSTVAAVLIERARGKAEQHARDARAEGIRAEENAKNAERQRERAVVHFAKARKAMDMLTEAGQEDVPQLELWQKELLAKVKQFYEELTQEESDDPEVLREKGKAYGRVGEIQRMLGNPTKAKDAFQKAIDVFTMLEREYGSKPEYNHDLAISHTDLAELKRNLDQVQEAEEHYSKAMGIEKTLVTKFPDESAYRQELARAHNNRGILFKQNEKRWKEAEEDYREAIRQLRRLTDIAEPEPIHRADLARSYLNRGNLFDKKGRNKEAEKDYREAIELLADLSNPENLPPAYRYKVREYQFRLGIAHNNLGNLLGKSPSRQQDRKDAHETAVHIFAKLTTEFPRIPLYRQELGNCCNSQGNALADAGKLDEAEEQYKEAQRLFADLVKEFSDVPEYKSKLGMALMNRAILLLDQEEIGRAALWAIPGSSLWNPGWWLFNRDRLTKAVDLLNQAIGYQQAAVKKSSRFHELLRKHYWYLAETHVRLGNHPEASQTADTLFQLSLEAGKDCSAPAYFFARCLPLVDKDLTLSPDQARRKIREYAETAIEVLQTAVDKKYMNQKKLNNPLFDPIRRFPRFPKPLPN